nr:MAG TPA: hypothetical protein [Caudoviricetes sp.]
MYIKSTHRSPVRRKMKKITLMMALFGVAIAAYSAKPA